MVCTDIPTLILRTLGLRAMITWQRHTHTHNWGMGKDNISLHILLYGRVRSRTRSFLLGSSGIMNSVCRLKGPDNVWGNFMKLVKGHKNGIVHPSVHRHLLDLSRCDVNFQWVSVKIFYIIKFILSRSLLGE